MLQVDEILGVAESARVGSVVRTADLRHDCRHLRERCKNIAGVGGEFFSLRKTGAIRQSAARPNRAFVQMRQEFRADHAAKAQIDRARQGNYGDASDNPAMPNGPAQPPAVLFHQEIHRQVAPLPNSFTEKDGGQHRRDENRECHGAEKSQGNRPGHGSE